MGSGDPGLTTLVALASIQRRLIAATLERARDAGPDSVSNYLSISDTARQDLPGALGARFGVAIAATLVERRSDGHENRWECVAWQPDGDGWRVEREVILNESPIGEPVTLVSSEFPDVEFHDTQALIANLPDLVSELLAVPALDLLESGA